MDWARLSVRGSPSRLTAVTPAPASCAITCGCSNGTSSPTRVCPPRSNARVCGSGRLTDTTTSARANRSRRATTVAPASA